MSVTIYTSTFITWQILPEVAASKKCFREAWEGLEIKKDPPGRWASWPGYIFLLVLEGAV